MKKLVITDVDGVMTDGGFYYNDTGKVMKKFGPHDADGVKMIREMGIDIIAISADKRGYDITKKRMDDMGITLYQVSESARKTFLLTYSKYHDVIFIGDGYYDAACLSLAWMGIAPANAVAVTKAAADYVCKTEGGQGVLLEVAIKLKGMDEINT